jgi:FkbM family methyltransferase
MKLFYVIYSVLFSKPILFRFHSALLHLSMRGLGIYNYENKYISGEIYFLKSVLKEIDFEHQLLVDIGGNEGDFTKYVLEQSINLNVVTFEPHPITFKRIKNRFHDNKRVTIVNKAIGIESDRTCLYDYYDSDGSGHASMVENVIEDLHHSKSVKYVIDLIRLDQYSFKGNVRFIKIDIEGKEKDAIEGASKLLSTNKVKYILIEFNEMNVMSKVFFKDILDLLNQYSAYRIMSGGKLLKLNNPYKAWLHEIFAYQNIAFINHSY